MNRRRSLVVLVGLATLSAGCFPEPATPLAGSRIETRLLGEWDCSSLEPSSTDRALLTILRFDAGQYYAEWKEGEKVERYRAYPGSLKGLPILNVTEIAGSADRPWFAVRTAFSSDGSMSFSVPAKRIADIAGDDVRLRTFRREADQAGAWLPFAHCMPHKEQ